MNNVRCVIYTRKSTDEGLEKEFNSLDAQRESGEAFIRSQKSEGWVCLPERYDDGGFTGGNMERPGLKRLLDDVKNAKVDCIVVYKVDRLSRSLMDFSQLMQVLERHDVSFVSVTQHFNTSSSMGRLTLNILLSFAQFEREIIAERTKDKIAAEKRKGRWMGGRPFLGYDVEDHCGGLMVNEMEADQVREAFRIYLETDSLSLTAERLNQKGWRLKRWLTKKGKTCGGGRFTKGSVHRLLTNLTYLGKISYEQQVFDGRHEAIVDEAEFKQVQQRLAANCRDPDGARDQRAQNRVLLKGLLRCQHCEAKMVHSTTRKKQSRVYRYYVCGKAMREGWDKCPTKSVPAGEIESFVVNQIRGLGSNTALLRKVTRDFSKRQKQRERALTKRRTTYLKERKRIQAETAKAVDSSAAPEVFNLLDERFHRNERELKEIEEELQSLGQHKLTTDEIELALTNFDPLWDSMTESERVALLQTLIRQITYDGESGKLAIAFHDCGISELLKPRAEPPVR